MRSEGEQRNKDTKEQSEADMEGERGKWMSRREEKKM